jgi:hypothetical protein
MKRMLSMSHLAAALVSLVTRWAGPLNPRPLPGDCLGDEDMDAPCVIERAQLRFR